MIYDKYCEGNKKLYKSVDEPTQCGVYHRKAEARRSYALLPRWISRQRENLF